MPGEHKDFVLRVPVREYSNNWDSQNTSYGRQEKWNMYLCL